MAGMILYSGALLFIITDLLQDYTDEAEAVARLREQASELEDDLRTLTSSFTEAAQRLSQCYQTP